MAANRAMADSWVQAPLPEGILFLQRGWLNSNSIVVRGEEEFTLFDSGYGTGAAELEQRLRGELALHRLARIINTHSHPDHSGGNAHLQALTGCAVWMSDIDAMLVESGDPVGLMWGYAQMTCAPFEVTRSLQPGERISVGRFDFEVLDGSGHASGEVSYYCREHRLVVCGDLLWKEGFSNVVPLAEGIGGLARHERSLRQLRQLDIEVALPGHGPPLVGREGVRNSIDRVLGRLHLLRTNRRKWAEASLKSFMTMKLLLNGAMPRREFVQICTDAPWYREHHARFFATSEPVIEALLADLLRQGAFREEAGERLSCTLQA